MYPAEIVLPMKAELVDNGFTDLTTAAEVTNVVNTNGTTMVVINSVCGCAGFDIEAVNQVRALHMPYPPSSPAIALFKDGKLVSMVERHQIEGSPAQVIAQHLISLFNEHCN
jgi:hypothetical protein